MRRLLSFLLVFSLCLSVCSWAGSSDDIQKIVSRAEGIKCYSQTMTMSMSMMGSQMTFNGKMWVKDSKMRMEMTIPPANMQQTIIYDGKMTYTYMPAMKMVQTMNTAKIKEVLGEDFASGMGGQGPQSEVNPFQGVDKATLAYLGEEEIAGEKVDVLEGKLAGDMEKMKEMMPVVPEKAKFWVAQSDGLPRKSAFYGKDGQEMFSQQYSDVSINPKMDDSLFVFETPEGAQVMDMTDAVIGMYGNMKGGAQPPVPPAN